jgi:predicted LPLAT superfamily acyltransferase
MATEAEHRNWKGTTGGTRWMQRAMIRWFRHTSLYVPYVCMGFVIPFYMLFGREGYKSSYSLYRKRFGMNPLKAFGYVYMNHFRFGQIIIDRFAAYAGHQFCFEVEGQEVFDALERGTCGFMQLSSHIGNYELAGYMLQPEHKEFYALVFGGETETVMKSRAEIFARHGVRMVAANSDMSHVFILSEALRSGNIVSMPGDRIFGSPRSVTCHFLGASADFPLGPFAMASQREVPILAVFVMKSGVKSYRILVRRLQGATRQELCHSFAAELEKTVIQYPTQWFNFYNFWK